MFTRCSFVKKENKLNYYRGKDLNYKVPKDIPIIIHNASYDTHFIVNQLAEKFKG